MIDEPIVFEVDEGEGDRVDKVLVRRFPETSRRRLRDLFERGLVRVDGRRAKKGDRVAAGAVVQLAASPTTDESLRPTAQAELDLAVVYDDEAIVIVDKPAGMASHPLRPGETGTLANALVARFPECLTVADDPREAGLTNRLDRGTTGAVVAARSRAAWLAMRAAFSSGAVEKAYRALVAGDAVSDGKSDAPLVHDRARGGVRLAGDRDFDALEARSAWSVEERFRRHALVTVTARTGRMHQVRAHLAAAGLPIVGDERYGGPGWNEPGHFLHAYRLAFAHPTTGAPVRVEVALPAERRAYLDRLRNG